MRKKWVALVCVRALKGNDDLGNAVGAFVNVAYQAEDENDLKIIIRDSFYHHNYEVISVEDVEDENNLTIENADESEKIKLINSINNGRDFDWGTFFTY